MLKVFSHLMHVLHTPVLPGNSALVCVCLDACSYAVATPRWPSEVAVGQMVRRSAFPRARSQTSIHHWHVHAQSQQHVPWQQNTYCNHLFSCRLQMPPTPWAHSGLISVAAFSFCSFDWRKRGIHLQLFLPYFSLFHSLQSFLLFL